jgi:transposase
MAWQATDLDGLIPLDHRARAVWEYVEELDLSEFHRSIRAVEGHSGRPAIDPAILVALWLFATIEGIGSARALDRLCGEHNAYRWLCGGVGVNYHTLADFRVEHGEALDRLLTQSVAALLSTRLVKLERVAQDGMRVRASAGAPSFRRRETLEDCLAQAEEQVRRLRAELEADPAATSRRQQASRLRAAEGRRKRVREARNAAREIERKRRAAKGGMSQEEARASTTDPEARVMKMGDGGYRPAFNAQLATDTKSQVIVGVEVTNSGSDFGNLVPMAEQLERRYGRRPKELLADGNFASHEDIRTLTSRGCRVYAPLPRPRAPGRDPHRPLPGDDRAIANWRRRMGTDRGKRIYRERGAAAECVNAIVRNRGLRQFLVRGRAKARAVLLWFALAHNLMRSLKLRAA